MSILLYFLQSVNPQNTAVARFRSLLAKYSNVDVAAMGFPCDWQYEALWQAPRNKYDEIANKMLAYLVLGNFRKLWKICMSGIFRALGVFGIGLRGLSRG